MSPEYLLRWGLAFVLTELVEVPIYRRMLNVGALRAFGASALTHPLLWFLVFERLPGNYVERVVLAEVWVWGAETAYFVRESGVRRAAFAALVANGMSVLVGHTLRSLTGLP